MEQALRAHLLAAAGLSALVGSRIDWNVRPQASGLPAVVLQRVSGSSIYHMEGRSARADALVQLDCWGGNYKSAKEVSRAVKAALDTLRTGIFRGAFIEGERDSFEAVDAPNSAGTTDFHRSSLDVRVWFSES